MPEFKVVLPIPREMLHKILATALDGNVQLVIDAEYKRGSDLKVALRDVEPYGDDRTMDTPQMLPCAADDTKERISMLFTMVGALRSDVDSLKQQSKGQSNKDAKQPDDQRRPIDQEVPYLASLLAKFEGRPARVKEYEPVIVDCMRCCGSLDLVGRRLRALDEQYENMAGKYTWAELLYFAKYGTLRDARTRQVLLFVGRDQPDQSDECRPVDQEVLHLTGILANIDEHPGSPGIYLKALVECVHNHGMNTIRRRIERIDKVYDNLKGKYNWDGILQYLKSGVLRNARTRKVLLQVD